MADLSITAASVLATATALCAAGIAGATITAGQPLYRDAAASNVLKPADSNGSAATSDAVGIALHGASTGQPVKYVYQDTGFTPGATLAVGQTYAVSATAGGICPLADLTTGDYPTVLFVATTAALATVKIVHGTAAKP